MVIDLKPMIFCRSSLLVCAVIQIIVYIKRNQAQYNSVCVEMKFRIDDSSYAVYSYFRDSFTNQKGNLDDVQVKKR